MTCPYCKAVDTRSSKIICTNCRNYNEAIVSKRHEDEERQLLKQYRFLPWNWREWEGWKQEAYFQPLEAPRSV